MTDTTASTHSGLEDQHQRWTGRRDRLLRAFTRAAQQHRASRMHCIGRHLHRVVELLACIEQLQAAQRMARPQTRRYVVSSLFLEACFRELTADDDEQLFFITGAEIDGACILDQKLEFAHQRRTRVGVTGQTGATHRLLIKLEQFGHRLLGHFHSHPGLGLSATTPSGTDERFQRRLEAAGYPAVAAIFSRDGYIRFFRLDGRVDVDIHGTGVDDLGNQTYRLRTLDQDARPDHSGRP